MRLFSLKVRKVPKVFEQRIIVSLLRKNFKAMAGRSRNPRRLCPKGMTEIGLLRTTFVLAANFILPVFANWASKNVTGPYAPEVFAPFWRYDPFFSQDFALDRVPRSTIASTDRFTRSDCLSVYSKLPLFIYITSYYSHGIIFPHFLIWFSTCPYVSSKNNIVRFIQVYSSKYRSYCDTY